MKPSRRNRVNAAAQAGKKAGKAPPLSKYAAKTRVLEAPKKDLK